jgi:hypothetical protein
MQAPVLFSAAIYISLSLAVRGFAAERLLLLRARTVVIRMSHPLYDKLEANPISLCDLGRVHNDHPSSWSLPHRIFRGRHSSRHEDRTYTSPGRRYSECWSCLAGAFVMQSALSTIFLTALLDV